MFVLIYFLIGIIVACINNHLWSKLETPDEKYADNTIMIIALFLWIVAWPISLVATISMIRELHRLKDYLKKDGNNKS